MGLLRTGRFNPSPNFWNEEKENETQSCLGGNGGNSIRDFGSGHDQRENLRRCGRVGSLRRCDCREDFSRYRRSSR